MRFSSDLEIAIANVLFISLTWLLLRLRWSGVVTWRQQAAKLAWVFTFAAAALHVIYASIRHSPKPEWAELAFRSLEGMGIMAIAGIVSGVIGREWRE
jgi:hypothetical protein